MPEIASDTIRVGRDFYIEYNNVLNMQRLYLFESVYDIVVFIDLIVISI